MSNAKPEPCEILEWDSDFFGFRIARVRGDILTAEPARNVDAWCRKEKVRCLYFLSRADDPETTRLAEDNGFRMVDIRVTLKLKISGMVGEIGRRRRVEATIRPACSQDAGAMLQLAGNSFHDTRFYFDPNFPRHLVDSMYQTWIKRYLDGDAGAMFVAELDGLPVGFLVCHMGDEPGVGILSLAAVSEEVRGRKIGKNLYNRGISWIVDRSATEIYGVTQGRNVVTLRHLQRLGFLIHNVQVWYHKWFDVQSD